MSQADFTTDELICCCISHQVIDGDVLAQGLATPLVAAGYLLAWRTHAPNVYFASAIGQSVCRRGAPLGLSTVEELWLDRSMRTFGFVRAAVDLLPRVKPKEFFRPGQIDARGSFNNIAFGRDPDRPRLRLPGTGGIPDVTTFIDAIYLYVPRHSRVTFVESLDYMSGMGHVRERRRGGGPRYLVTDLGQFDFQEGKMRLTHLHPGVTRDRVQVKTGFPLDVSPNLAETQLPTTEELRLLREEVDPLGIRRLEGASGARRRELIRQILAAEAKARAVS